MTSILVASAFVLMMASPLAAQSADPPNATADANAAGQKGEGEKRERSRVRFVMGNRVSLRAGDMLRIDFRVKMHGDVRTFRPDVATDEGLWDLNKRRLGIEGTFLRHFEYQLEGDLRENNPWRDVYVNFRYFDKVQIRAGKFKIPFSLDELTPATDLEFIYRSRIGDNLSPSRDVGVTAHGRFFRRGLGYEAGVFSHDGEHDENGRYGRPINTGRTVAGRLTARPLRLMDAPAGLSDLEMGVNATSGTVPEGQNALRGRTAFREDFFWPVSVDGRRVRFGLDTDWRPGPFWLKGEFIRVQDERRNQGLEGEDLPPLILRGWYVSSAWAITGEQEGEGIVPKRPLFEGGVGAVEIAARYERNSFGSSAPGEPPSRSPRAAKVLEAGDHVSTFGVNWYPNRWVRIQLNAVREWLADPDRSPIPGRATFWTRVFRLQFVL